MAGGRDVILPELPRLTPADGHDRVDLAHGAYSPPHSCSAHPGGTHPKTIAEQKALAEMWLVTSPITSSPCSPPTSELIQPPRPGQAGIVRVDKARLHAIVDEQPSISGRLQVNTALAVMDTLADHLDRLLSTARSVKGARALMHDIYGVGSLSSLALCAWLGGADRFTSSRKAVRFVGLDITVHSSDGKRAPAGSTAKAPKCCAGYCSKPPRPPPAPAHPATATTLRSKTATTRTGPACPKPAASSDTAPTS
jgi:hypothetical protein